MNSTRSGAGRYRRKKSPNSVQPLWTDAQRAKMDDTDRKCRERATAAVQAAQTAEREAALGVYAATMSERLTNLSGDNRAEMAAAVKEFSA